MADEWRRRIRRRRRSRRRSRRRRKSRTLMRGIGVNDKKTL